MTTKEKLESFRNNTIEAATKQADREVEQYHVALDQIFAQHKEEKNAESEQRVADERLKYERKTNKLLTAAQAEIRQKFSDQTLRIRNRVFNRVEQKLIDFKRSPEYLSYLCGKIREMQGKLTNESGKGILFFVDSTDADLIEPIQKQSGVTIQISKENIIGGLRALVPSRSIMIDNSFASLLAEEEKAFSAEGGMRDE